MCNKICRCVITNYINSTVDLAQVDLAHVDLAQAREWLAEHYVTIGSLNVLSTTMTHNKNMFQSTSYMATRSVQPLNTQKDLC